MIDRPPIERLSERQRQCLAMVWDRKPSKEIARALGISPYTVDGHIADAMTVLGAKSRVEAARMLAQGTPESLGGELPPVADKPDAAVSEVSPQHSDVLWQGRHVKIGRWARLGIIVGLTVAIIYAVILLMVGGDALERRAREARQASTTQR